MMSANLSGKIIFNVVWLRISQSQEPEGALGVLDHVFIAGHVLDDVFAALADDVSRMRLDAE
jgi:hypothetical protein